MWPEIAAPRGILDWVSHPYYPLWSGEGIRKYAPHFWFFLEAVLDRDIMTRIWKRCCQVDFDQALTDELGELGADLDELLTEFAIWNYFAGHRDDGRHYDPACQVPAVYHQEGHGEYPVPATSLPESKIAQPAVDPVTRLCADIRAAWAAPKNANQTNRYVATSSPQGME